MRIYSFFSFKNWAGSGSSESHLNGDKEKNRQFSHNNITTGSRRILGVKAERLIKLLFIINGNDYNLKPTQSKQPNLNHVNRYRNHSCSAERHLTDLSSRNQKENIDKTLCTMKSLP